MGDIGTIKKITVEPAPMKAPVWEPKISEPTPMPVITPERELVPVRR